MNKINLNHIDFNGGSGGGEGTSNYNDLSNKPKINNIELSGSKTISELGGANKTLVVSSIPSGGISSNTLYTLGILSGTITISLAAPTDSTISNHYFFTFETGATAPTITWDATITSWMGGSAPTINANKHYEVSVLNGVGVAMEV